MQLKRISFSHFRNLAQGTIDLSSSNPKDVPYYKNIYISGKNGQGKTSILEAIFILSHVRSFRSSSLKDTISIHKKEKTNAHYAYISAIVETDLGDVELEISIDGKRRELLRNKKKIQSLDSFCGVLKTVLFTPEDLEIVKGAPQIRRQFLDRIIAMVEPRDIGLLNEYAKKIKFRNALLKSGDIKAAKLFIDDLVDLNIKIIDKRKNLISDLKKRVVQIYSKIVGEEEETFDLSYHSSFIIDDVLLDKDQIKRAFQEIENKEMVMGRTLLGNHKDELRIDLIRNGTRSVSKVTSSQGQIRTKILSFKLASSEIIKEKTGQWPILLLDDVEAELDSDRRSNLRKIIDNYNGQVFLTGTEFPEQNFSKNDTLNLMLREGIFN